MILSKNRITKALIRLGGCAGWFAPVLFATPEDRFSHVEPPLLSCAMLYLLMSTADIYIFVNSLEPDQPRQNVEPNLALMVLLIYQTLILEKIISRSQIS